MTSINKFRDRGMEYASKIKLPKINQNDSESEYSENNNDLLDFEKRNKYYK